MLRLLKLLALAALPALIASQAHAQASRTWVSGVGNDADPCSRTAPCKTWAGAISKTAAGGEIDAMDSGGFGAVTITKSITLAGDGVLASILVSGTNGIVVAAQPTDVVYLRNINIISLLNSVGVPPGLNGILFLSGGELHVEGVYVFGFGQQGLSFTPSGASSLFVHNSSLRNNAGGAIEIQPGAAGTAVVTVSNTAMDGGGRGLRAEDGSSVTVRNSHASGNTANGFVALSTAVVPRPIKMTLESVVSDGNGATGVFAGAQATVNLSNTTIVNNHDGIQMSGGGTTVSFGNNHIRDNQFNNGPPSSTPGPQ
jgi:hypothetical protein